MKIFASKRILLIAVYDNIEIDCLISSCHQHFIQVLKIILVKSHFRLMQEYRNCKYITHLYHIIGINYVDSIHLRLIIYDKYPN